MSQPIQDDYKALNYRCYKIQWTWIGQFAGTDTYYGWFRDIRIATDFGRSIARSKTKDGMIWQLDIVTECEGCCQ